MTLRLLMEAHVRAELANGSLMATGYRTHPGLSEQPEIVPAFMFESQAVIINWDVSEISGLGRRFESVTVSQFHVPANENEPVAPPMPSRERRGPKGYGVILAEAVAALNEQEQDFSDWTLEKQVMAIQDKAAALHPGRFNGGKPGRSTVYKYLSEHPA